MNIELSTTEYRDLLDILHIADVIMTAHRQEDDRRTLRHLALIQKLYAAAGGEGLEKLVGFNKGFNEYTPTKEFEESSIAHPVINEFGDHLFWDQLISRLTERDTAFLTGGTGLPAALSDRERSETRIRQRYIEEFTENGISNLAIIEEFGAGGKGLIKTSD